MPEFCEDNVEPILHGEYRRFPFLALAFAPVILIIPLAKVRIRSDHVRGTAYPSLFKSLQKACGGVIQS
jgi:hypothetical protein